MLHACATFAALAATSQGSLSINVSDHRIDIRRGHHLVRDSQRLVRVASRVGSRNKSTVKLSTIFPTQPLTEPTFGASINHDFPLIITVSTVNDTRRDHDTASEFTTAPNSVQEIK
ncbi:hypothetical protein PC9H_009018 [Pleurotus ostreatus]|uniref:Uncharacterized protein n=1 Tax=Pleurotus ostreatus TaxID=5322 RepID=A0A8H6ZSE5_PLEOS|nr:uncharacterized protein PC9H_009018 [Pleurotus ostreatus]KAF7426649.1 hypothetical protein PC9H_009018 [Pleurotus ostreatus]